MKKLLAVMALTGLVFFSYAESTLLNTVSVNQNVPDSGVLRRGFTWSDSSLQTVSSVAVTLNFSSPFASNPINLNQLSASLRFGLSSEEFRLSILFNAGELTALTQRFEIPDALDGQWMPSNYWRLDITDNQGGGIARLDSFTMEVSGIPEPSSLSLLLAGGAVLMAGRWRESD